MYNRNEILELLRGRWPIIVEFTKNDGTNRVMKCSLNNKYISEEHRPKSKSIDTYHENLDIIRVFDLEKEGWRSFRVDSVKGIQIKA